MPSGLILDFGGVLTTDYWDCLRGFCRREGLPPETLVDLVTRDAAGRRLLMELERGTIRQVEFERAVSARLGVPAEGLIERMAADLRPEEDMLDAVRRVRAAGARIAILSNSWGTDRFDPYAPWRLADRADVVVISDQVRMRKPDRAIFELAVEKLGVPATECVFVDDIAAYLEPARELGMRVIHHVDAATTRRQLAALFGVDLSRSIGSVPVRPPAAGGR